MIDKKRLIRLTQDVIRIPSENPPGNEKKLADFIMRTLRPLKLAVRVYCFEKNRPNIVAVLKGSGPRQSAAREALVLSPHIDTVPAGKGWRFDPFGGTLRGGRIYGRGATDDKGNLACSIEVLRSLVEDGVRFKKDIILAATVDEETGSRAGIIPLIEKNILRPRLALILDSDECDTIIAQKGLIHCRVQVLGKRAHGAYNWRGVNAIEIAARVIDALKKHAFRCKKHPLLRPPTINIGTIHGGDRVNIVADFCEFSVDVRFVPGMKPLAIIAQLRTIIGAHAHTYRLVIDNVQQPYEISATHPFVQAYVNTARTLNIHAELKGSEGATVITFFQKKGIAAFATGFGSHTNAHTTDEWVSTAGLYRGAKLLERFIKEYDTL